MLSTAIFLQQFVVTCNTNYVSKQNTFKIISQSLNITYTCMWSIYNYNFALESLPLPLCHVTLCRISANFSQHAHNLPCESHLRISLCHGLVNTFSLPTPLASTHILIMLGIAIFRRVSPYYTCVWVCVSVCQFCARGQWQKFLLRLDKVSVRYNLQYFSLPQRTHTSESFWPGQKVWL